MAQQFLVVLKSKTAMEESSMQQCGFFAYSCDSMLANASKMMVGDGIINQGSSSLRFFRKSSSEDNESLRENGFLICFGKVWLGFLQSEMKHIYSV